jgi:hypothetical protein
VKGTWSPTVALSLSILALAAITTPSAAVTYVVKPDSTGDFPTIQDAVEAAADGDEIVLADGVYRGYGNRNIDYLGRAITVRSMSGNPDLCAIDLEWTYCECIVFQSGETEASVLEGVSVLRSDDGVICVFCKFPGAIHIAGASPTIRNVTVSECSGDGIYVDGGAPVLEDCSIVNNYGTGLSLMSASATITGGVIAANSSSRSHGGGMFLSGSDATIENCDIRRNSAYFAGGPHRGGGIFIGRGAPVIRNSVIAENWATHEGGGIYAASGASGPEIVGCTIASNEAATGGGIYVRGDYHGAPGVAVLERTILWGNCASVEGREAYVAAAFTAEFQCSDVDSAGVAGPGSVVWVADNLFTDPLLCEPADCPLVPSIDGVYSLRKGSPALNAPNCGLIGALGVGCLVSVEASSWARIKAQYR